MFDLYRLSENEGKGSIRAVFTRELKDDFLLSVKEMERQVKIKDFCKYVGIDYTTFWDYSNRREYVPLFVLKELEKISKRNLKSRVQYLEVGAGHTKNKIKAVHELSEDLAKIIGAYAADGSLRKRKNTWNGKEVTHYELVFREGFASNMKALSNWIINVFGIKPKMSKERNHYCIYISNKIIFRYFTDILGFKPGRKTETISAPEFVKDSSKKIKKSFMMGVLMFDCSVNYRNGYIELYSRSKGLIMDMAFLLNDIGISPDYINLQPDRFGRYRIKIRRFEKLRKCLELFENKTEKWWRLKEHLHGFDDKTKSLDVLMTNLDEFYPNVRKSAIALSDVVKSINLLQTNDMTPNFTNISKSLNKRSTVIYEYLRKLERLGILKTRKRGQQKTWFLNEEFPYPKRR